MQLIIRRILAFVFVASLCVSAYAAEGLVSTMRNAGGATEDRGYSIRPVYEMARIIPGDEAPAQAFEIFRPDDGAVELGRLFTSCSCIRLETPKKSYGPGERVVLTLRNVRPTPHDGQVYQIFVQMSRPIRTTLRYNVFVQSERFQRTHQPTTVTAAPAGTVPGTVVETPVVGMMTSDMSELPAGAVVVDNNYAVIAQPGVVVTQ